MSSTSSRRRRLAVESLEARDVPAHHLVPIVFTFTDVDGDAVTVRTTKGTNAQLAAAVTEVAGQLQELDLTHPDFIGTNVTITAKRNPAGGDGFVNVGRIDSTGQNLGMVSVAGDLGQIDAGNGDAGIPAIRGLTVQSMGVFGTSTQAGGGDLISTVTGFIAAMTVRSDFVEANLFADGGIRRLIVGGSVVGGAANDSGQIRGSVLGPVTIGGSIVGGGGESSGVVRAADKIAAVTVGGSVIGGSGITSGRIDTTDLLGGDIGPVTIKGDLIGGSAERSGVVAAVGDLLGVTIGGSLFGGTDTYTLGLAGEAGQIFGDDSIGAIRIGADIIGGPNDGSAGIFSNGPLKSLTVGGSIIGGAGSGSAIVFIDGSIGAVRVTGDVRAGNGGDSASVQSEESIASVTIGGSLVGGADEDSALISADGALGSVRIGRDLIGGAGDDSGKVISDTSIASVTIGGSVVGGAGNRSAVVFSQGPMGLVTVGRDLRGAAGAVSGSVGAHGDLAGVTVRGSVVGGAGPFSGSIMAEGTLKRVTIGGSVTGTAAVPVQVSGVNGIGPVSVKGTARYLNILAGYVEDFETNGDASIGAVSVGGDWIGGNIVAGTDAGADLMFGTPDDALIAGGGATVAQIASILIRGQVVGTVGGVDHFGFVAEKIGRLQVGATVYPLTTGVDVLALGATGDMFAREDVV